ETPYRPTGRSIPTTSIAPRCSRIVTCTGLAQCGWRASIVLIETIAYRDPEASAGPQAPSGIAARGLPRSISSPTARSAPALLSSADQRTLYAAPGCATFTRTAALSNPTSAPVEGRVTVKLSSGLVWPIQ